MNLRLRCTDAPVIGFGALLQAAERLIRLGARAAVVCDVLDIKGPSRALVRRMYVAMRGPGRPRGPLPFDHVELLSTVAARLDAAVFLDAWQRLRAAGVDAGPALAAAWECLEAAVQAADRSAGRPARRLGIDQGWVLACSLEQGFLHRLACDHCGRSYFDACLRPQRQGSTAVPMPAAAVARPPHVRCPHCVSMRNAGRAAGIAQGLRAGATPADRGRPASRVRSADRRASQVDPSRSHPLADLARRYAWAEALFRAGARPPIVTHVTGLAMTGTLRQLFIDVVGHGPRQGALPQLGEHIVATYARKLQSSVVAVTADRLVRAGYAPAPTLLETWNTYRSLFGASARFDINAVALVLRARHHPDFTLLDCRACGCAYLELRLDVPGSRCPVCRPLRQAHADAAAHGCGQGGGH